MPEFGQGGEGPLSALDLPKGEPSAARRCFPLFWSDRRSYQPTTDEAQTAYPAVSSLVCCSYTTVTVTRSCQAIPTPLNTQGRPRVRVSWPFNSSRRFSGLISCHSSTLRAGMRSPASRQAEALPYNRCGTSAADSYRFLTIGGKSADTRRFSPWLATVRFRVAPKLRSPRL
jgi:hypothetical protein